MPCLGQEALKKHFEIMEEKFMELKRTQERINQSHAASKGDNLVAELHQLKVKCSRLETAAEKNEEALRNTRSLQVRSVCLL